MIKKIAGAAAAMALLASSAMAADEFRQFPIGDVKIVNTLEVAAVYLEPVDIEPDGVDLASSLADIHLQAEIHAAESNVNGFGAGEWMPYLSVAYRLENRSTGKIQTGNLMPMVAIDGPHYGSNVKMPGAGDYKLTYHIEPPSRQGVARHIDKGTGVGPWFQPFDVEFDFKYVPLKK